MTSNKIVTAQSVLSREEWEKVYFAVKMIVEDIRKERTSDEFSDEYMSMRKEWETLLSKVDSFTHG